MANNLPFEKKVTVISALCEGASIRGIERMTGINRNTIMGLGVRMGNACEKILDERMRGLQCRNIEVDEAWGYIGKKAKHANSRDRAKGLGDIWVFVALCVDSKLISSFAVGRLDLYHPKHFMDDLASRLKYRPQISSDALAAYKEAVEYGFGH